MGEALDIQERDVPLAPVHPACIDSMPARQLGELFQRHLISVGYSPKDADDFLSDFASYHITSHHLLNIIYAIKKARDQQAPEVPSDLSSVIEAWDRLPEAVRVGIVAMV